MRANPAFNTALCRVETMTAHWLSEIEVDRGYAVCSGEHEDPMLRRKFLFIERTGGAGSQRWWHVFTPQRFELFDTSLLVDALTFVDAVLHHWEHRELAQYERGEARYQAKLRLKAERALSPLMTEDEFRNAMLELARLRSLER
jgi:hypothetical protein